MTKSEIKTLLFWAGLALFFAGLVTMIILAVSFPYPGAFNALVRTPEVPLMGFWIAIGILAGTVAGFGAWIASRGIDDSK